MAGEDWPEEFRRHLRAACREWLLAGRALIDALLPAIEPEPETTPADDLTAIRGIGPTLAARLQRAGVTRYETLANTTPEQLSEITGRSVARITAEGWIAQARELAQNRRSSNFKR